MWIIEVNAKKATLFISYHDIIRYVTDKAKLVQENECLRSATTCKKCKITGVETLLCLVVILPAVKNVPAAWKTVIFAMRRY